MNCVYLFRGTQHPPNTGRTRRLTWAELSHLLRPRTQLQSKSAASSTCNGPQRTTALAHLHRDERVVYSLADLAGMHGLEMPRPCRIQQNSADRHIMLPSCDRVNKQRIIRVSRHTRFTTTHLPVFCCAWNTAHAHGPSACSVACCIGCLP